MSDRERAREMLTLLWGECDYDQAATAIATELAQARAEGLRQAAEALTPSAETKAAYMGEFSFSIPALDENGEEASQKVTVPWTTIKEIMAAISLRALAEAGE